MESPHDIRIVIPEASWLVAKFRQEDLPGIAVINSALKEPAIRPVFRWHLSLMMHYKDLIQNGMPSQEERNLTEPFCDQAELEMSGDSTKPNALMLARITWNGTRELIWRVFDPKMANGLLQQYLKPNAHPRPIDYRMDDDPSWKLAAWHLNASGPK